MKSIMHSSSKRQLPIMSSYPPSPPYSQKHRFAKGVRYSQVINRLHLPVNPEVSTQDQANPRPRLVQAKS